MSTLKTRFKKDKFPFILPKIMEFINTLDSDKEYDIEIKQHRKKRSLNANNY